MIATIALDDGLILPHSPNPTGSNFRKGQAAGGERELNNKLYCTSIMRPQLFDAEPCSGCAGATAVRAGFGLEC